MSRFTVYYYRDIYTAVVSADSPQDAIEALDHGRDEITAVRVEDEDEKVVWREGR